MTIIAASGRSNSKGTRAHLVPAPAADQTDAVEISARRAGADIANPDSRAAVSAQLAEAAAFLTGLQGGLHLAQPDGQEVAATVESQIGSALLAVRLLADRIALGAVFEDAGDEVEDEVGDDVEPMYALTASQLAAYRDKAFQAGMNARDLVDDSPTTAAS